MADSRSLMKRIVRICQPANDPIPITGEITVSSGPIRYVFNAVNVEVNLDTVTPANNRPLPVDLYDANGQRGSVPNKIEVASTGTVAVNSSVESADVATPLITSNPKRVQVIITNTDTKRLWISFVNPATGTEARFLDKDETMFITTWKGSIFGIWQAPAGSGFARIEEISYP